MTPRQPSSNLLRLGLLCLCSLLCACTSPATYAQRSEEALQTGDWEAAEQALAQGLEGHPDDLSLLIAAAELHLRTLPEELYKPRLALHYAMRADRAADNQSPRAAALLMRAWRANGGSEQGDRLLAEGLSRIGHPDALAHKRLGAVDPDLLAPTPDNLREQARRDAERASDESPCGGTLGFVGSAAWPLPDGRVSREQAFCIERDASPGTCAAKGLRSCTLDERAIACGPMIAVLGPHPGCVVETVERCCSAPRTR